MTDQHMSSRSTSTKTAHPVHVSNFFEDLEEHQRRFASHPFFRRLAEAEARHAFDFAPTLGFWVMAFQDLLQRNTELIGDPGLRHLANLHMLEDRGHEQWFLSDLERLNLPMGDLTTIFARRSRPVRDATYELVSEVFRTEDDGLRIVLLLVLEAAGRVFFERVAARAESLDQASGLRYFAASHLAVEVDHDLHAESNVDALHAILEPETARCEAHAMIRRAFAAFDGMMTGLVDCERGRDSSTTLGQ